MDKPLLKSLAGAGVLLYSITAMALSLNGVTDFGKVTEINARSAAVIAEIAVSPGSRVNEGDLLLRFDDTAHRARRDRAKARVDGLKPALNVAELELERALELYDHDSLSEVELKNAENRLVLAQADLHSAEAELRLASYELRQMRINAPASARVLNVNASRGRYVDPRASDSALVTLVDSRNMKAIAVLTSDQWSPALLGKKATVMYRGTAYTGAVSRLGLQRVEQAGGLPAYELEISFSTEKLIPAQMPVRIEISE